MRYERLSRSDYTKIMAGYIQFSPEQLEEEIKADSEIGRKLKKVEDILEKYY